MKRAFAALALLPSASTIQVSVDNPPALRVISFGSAALDEPARSALENEHAAAALLPLAEPLRHDELPAALPPCGDFEWLHIATTFKELTAAKSNGAVTLWLNEQAWRDADNLDTGFLGAAIVGDFADALCAAEADVCTVALAAQLAAIEKAAKEEQRAAKDLATDLANEIAQRPVAWDAKPNEDSDPWGDSVFGEPAPEESQSPFESPWSTMKPAIDLADAVPATGEQGLNDPSALILKLKGLLDAGAITQEEFDQKKREFLDRM